MKNKKYPNCKCCCERCNKYDHKKNRCTNIGVSGKVGVCWMAPSEEEY